MDIGDSQSSSCNLYVRGEESGDRELITKMMKAIEVDNWEIRDINTHDISTFPPCKVGIAFGNTCGRLVQPVVKSDHFFTLPALKQLQPTKENTTHRKKAWKILEEIKDALQNKTVSNDWGYAILRVEDKRLCIYSKNKPDEENIDIYLNENDCNMVLDIYKAFKASKITFGEQRSQENDNESNQDDQKSSSTRITSSSSK